MGAHKIQSIAVVGAGAVGCFFGGLLARAGYDVTLIGRSIHVDAIKQHGLRMECLSFDEFVQVHSSTEIQEVARADLVLVCVKSLDTQSCANDLKKYLKNDAIVLSLQNGIENTEILQSHLTQSCHPAVVYVATSMPGPGHVKHFGRGELLIGDLFNKGASNDQLKLISEKFTQAHIPTSISEDIKAALWSKFLVNCTHNAISAIAQITYSEMTKIPDVHQLIQNLTKEFLAVANHEGVNISLDLAMSMNQKIAITMPHQKSSTAQDLQKKKPSEINHLNGLIVRKGYEYSIPTPHHEIVLTFVKLIEASQKIQAES